MKYQQLIEEAAQRLGYTARPSQLDAVDQILIAFIDDKMTNVILNASTGSGKSLIGALAAEVLCHLETGDVFASKASLMLTATNVLSAQYEKTFGDLALTGKYLMLKGATNYSCDALSDDEGDKTGEDCALSIMLKAGGFDALINQHCDHCEFAQAKSRRNSVRHLSTNYAYYFVDRLYINRLEKRNLVVWDEAHLVNDLFSSFNAIEFSKKSLEKAGNEIGEMVGWLDPKTQKVLIQIIKDLQVDGKINSGNYFQYLTALRDVYVFAAAEGVSFSEQAARRRDMKAYNKYTRFSSKYEGLALKINELLVEEYEHSFEYNYDDARVAVKPIFVGKMIDRLFCSDHNLFMSATISEEYMLQTMELDPTATRFIKIESTFPKENKEIVFYDTIPLSYKTLQEQVTVNRLCSNVTKVVDHHVAKDERGIVLTPSFKLQKEIMKSLRSIKGVKIFEHEQGTKLQVALSSFKAYKGLALLVSPAMFEGVDLPDDLSRFQVFVKAPYPSLGDKRMKYILDRYPQVYELITIMKVTQGAGRSVRSETDYATTYCLDSNLQRVWNSRLNVWKNEFVTRFTKFL